MRYPWSAFQAEGKVARRADRHSRQRWRCPFTNRKAGVDPGLSGPGNGVGAVAGNSGSWAVSGGRQVVDPQQESSPFVACRSCPESRLRLRGPPPLHRERPGAPGAGIPWGRPPRGPPLGAEPLEPDRTHAASPAAPVMGHRPPSHPRIRAERHRPGGRSTFPPDQALIPRRNKRIANASWGFVAS